MACLGAEVFKFPLIVVFGGFLAEEEVEEEEKQRIKLVSAHLQIPL